MSDTDKNPSPSDPDGADKTRADELPDGSSPDGSDDTDRDTASGGPA